MVWIYTEFFIFFSGSQNQYPNDIGQLNYELYILHSVIWYYPDLKYINLLVSCVSAFMEKIYSTLVRVHLEFYTNKTQIVKVFVCKESLYIFWLQDAHNIRTDLAWKLNTQNEFMVDSSDSDATLEYFSMVYTTKYFQADTANNHIRWSFKH